MYLVYLQNTLFVFKYIFPTQYLFLYISMYLCPFLVMGILFIGIHCVLSVLFKKCDYLVFIFYFTNYYYCLIVSLYVKTHNNAWFSLRSVCVNTKI